MFALTFLEYAYGRYIVNLKIDREIHLIESENDSKRLSKLIGRVKFTKLLMPSKYTSDYIGEQPYFFDNNIAYLNSIHFTDRHGSHQFGITFNGATKGFIEIVHKCCEEYLQLLENINLKPSDRENSVEKNSNEIIDLKNKDLRNDLTLEDTYHFLKLHFQLDVEKEEFLDIEDNSFVTISGSSFYLWKKELPKYMIGYMLKYFFELQISFQKRLIFKYEGQGVQTELYYPDVLKALKDKEREVRKGETSEDEYKIFKSNLEKQLRLYLLNKEK